MLGITGPRDDAADSAVASTINLKQAPPASHGREDLSTDDAGEIPAGGGIGGEEEDDDDAEDASLEPFAREELPAHHCQYCGVHAPDAVVQCTTTKRWFCNTAHRRSGSCIVQHLVHSKGRAIRLHPKGPLGESAVVCMNCGADNVFALGSLPTEDGDVVVLACRGCLVQGSLDHKGLSLEKWQPIIREKSLVEWLCRAGNDEERARAWPYTLAQVRALEELWQRKPKATLEDAGGHGVDGEGGGDTEEAPLPQMELRYRDGAHMQAVLGALVDAEAEEDRRLRESVRRTGVSVEWA